MLLEKVYSGKPQGSVPSLDLFLGSITAQLGMRGDPQGCVCVAGGEVTKLGGAMLLLTGWTIAMGSKPTPWM